MDYLQVTGGLKAEGNIKIENNAVDIGLEDIVSSEESDIDPFEHDDEEPLSIDRRSGERENLNIEGLCVLETDKSYLKSPPYNGTRKQMYDEKEIRCNKVQKNNGNNDKISKDIKTENNQTVQETLFRNYTTNKDLLTNNVKEELQEGTTKVKSFSDRTNEATATSKHTRKAKVTTVPGSLFQCEKCGYQTTTLPKLKLHLINHKELEDDANFTCRRDHCEYETYRLNSLQEGKVHKLNHLKPEEIQFFYCYHCNFKAKRKDSLKGHVLRHFKNNEVPFHCFICDFNTKKRNVLDCHIKKHLGVISKTEKASIVENEELLESPLYNGTRKQMYDEKEIRCNNKVQKNNSNNDKISKDIKAENNQTVQEALFRNYTTNKDLLINNVNEELQEETTEVDGFSYWFEYQTDEVTPTNEDIRKVKVTTVPTSIILPSEYTEEDFDKFRCNHCQFISKRLRFIKKHIRIQHREVTKTYHCPYCPFTSKYSLRSHIICNHKSESEIKWFRCSQCPFKSKLKPQLVNHMVVHMDRLEMIDRLHKCDKCPKTYKFAYSVQKHVRRVHNEVKKVKCTQCDYESKYPRQVKEHVLEQHSDLDKMETLQCSKCNFNTKLKYRYAAHLRNKHPGNMFQCEKCAYQATTLAKLKLHLINHQEIKDDADLKYRCDHCDYKTYRYYSLQVHKLNHLKPEEIQFFYCHHCNFKAKRKDNLKTHVLRHFKNNEVPFHCFICDFNTKKRNVLDCHIKKHLEVKSKTEKASIVENEERLEAKDKCKSKRKI